ncbi:MAG: hypothetical protein Q4E59_04915 [Bacteroidales bacterium]|nr:hypothetical protein [Bacteroidales bacterium]
MRKITFVLSLFLTLIGTTTVSADVVTELQGKYISAIGDPATTITSGQWYILRNVGRTSYHGTNCYGLLEGTSYKITSTEPVASESPSADNVISAEGGYLFKISTYSSDESYYTVQSSDGKYLSLSWNSSSQSSSEVKYTIAQVDATNAPTNFYLLDEDNGYVLDGQQPGYNMVGWGESAPSSAGSNDSYQLLPVTLADAGTIDVTYKFQLDGADYQSATVTQTFCSVADAEAYSVLPDYLSVVSYSNTDPLTENTEITVVCEEDLPFVKTTDLNNPVWQVIDIHANEANYTWQYSSSDNSIQTPVVAKSSATVLDDSYYWCFVGNLVDGFKIYNKAAGTNYTVYKASDGDNQVVMSTENSRNQFKIYVAASSSIYENGSTTRKSTCFKIDGDSYYINHRNPILQGWNDTDGGSSCRFFTPASYVLNYANDIYATPVGTVGGYAYFDSDEDIEAYNTAVSTSTASPYDLTALSDLATIVAGIVEAGTNSTEIVDGGYYRVLNAQTGLAMKKAILYDPDYSTSNIQWNSVDKTTINAIFQIENAETSDKYVIKNCNTGTYMQGMGGALGTKPTAGSNGEFSLSELATGQYAFKFGNGTMHANGHGNGTGSRGNLVSWTTGANDASSWFIVRATEVEIAMNSLGENTYATIYLPFAVTPEEGVTAYTGTVDEANSEVTLSAKSGVLPAANGYILEGTTTPATLTITTETAEIGTNDLLGTYTSATSADNYRIFSAVDNVLGFYTNSSTTLAANKAYISLATGTAQGLKLNFGGVVDAIESVETEDAQTEGAIYDLSGRGVKKASKGLYIQNGKKVYIK